jgi:hypothetical protein
MLMFTARLQARLGLAAAACVFGVAISIVLAGTFEKPSPGVGLPGSPAAAFRLPDLTGTLTHFSSLRGDVLVLCFASAPAATALSPEFARLADLSERYGSKSGVELVAIRSNSEELTPDQMAQIERQARESDCLTLLDPTGHVSRLYRIDRTPSFVIVDRTGTIRYRDVIDETTADASAASAPCVEVIDALLAERAPAQPTAVLSKIK